MTARRKTLSSVIPLYRNADGGHGADTANPYFRALGHNRDRLFFVTTRGRQILSFPHTKLAQKASLFMLAPLQWWEREFPSDKGVAYDQALNAVIAQCFAQGVFRLDRVRGRGAWYDDGRLVIHAGDRLYVDGVETELAGMESRYVYEALPGLAVDMASPLCPAEATELLRLCWKLDWEQPIYGTLLAGWTTIAIACGAIPWRPHLFLTGPSGCGKSWVAKQIQQLLGDFMIAAKGETSEAGLRQSLQYDALPVTHDEAEGEDQRTAANLDRIMGLMRGASAEVDGSVLKGGQDGTASSYTVRSMFLLSAIRVPIKQTADETRITVVTLKGNTPGRRDVFKTKIEPLAEKIVDPEYARRFRARVFTLLPALRRNVATFSAAAGSHFGSQRLGDQIGPMAAGAYLLQEDGEITADAALAWMEHQQWPDQDEISTESDEAKCLTSLLEAKLSVSGERARIDLSVGELVAVAAARKHHFQVTATDARDVLARSGILVSGNWVTVSNTHRGVSALLRDTSWGVGWGRILKRIVGAVATKGRPYFAGSQSRGVMIPIGSIVEPSETA